MSETRPRADMALTSAPPNPASSAGLAPPTVSMIIYFFFPCLWLYTRIDQAFGVPNTPIRVDLMKI